MLRAFCVAWLGVGSGACDPGGPVEEEAVASVEKDTGEDIRAAMSALKEVRVLATHEDQVPAFIRGHFGQASRGAAGAAVKEAHESVLNILRQVAPVFRLSPEELVLKRVSRDEQGHRYLRYGQLWNGREVIGAELLLFLDAEGNAYAVNSSAHGGPKALAAVQPSLSAEAAVVSARRATGARRMDALGTGRLVYVRSEEARLVLAYEVRVTGVKEGLPVDDWVYVDAVSGEVALRNPRIHTVLGRSVYSANSSYRLPGTLMRGEGAVATQDAHVDVNYELLGKTYDCYQKNFGRDSYDGAGALLKSTVHYSEDGSGYVNAYWNGSQMVYGDGDGEMATELGKDLDVTVHELTHAVTEAESNLLYSNEPGALNEAWSDIFSAYCESWTRGWAMDADVWLIGEDVWTPAIPGDALRYMGNPTQDDSSHDYYPERYRGSSDYGGVHSNSGIANLAFKLLATGGTHPRAKTSIEVTGIGVQKAGKIFYEANANCMTASSNFAAAKLCTEQKAEQFHPGNKGSVTDAWKAVGVGVGVDLPPEILILGNGTPVSGVSVGGGMSKYYKLTVPPGQARLKFVTSGGSGDLDLYVKLGAVGDPSSYDCKSDGSSNAEECVIPEPAAGDWYVTLLAYSSFSGVTLTGSYSSAPAGGNVLANGVSSAAYGGTAKTWTCWTLEVPASVTKVTFSQTGGARTSGDADLYVQYQETPTTLLYQCKSSSKSNTDACTLQRPAPGLYFACSYGYGAYTNVTMKGSY
ncbi:M4 family metallopeptidase [Stigmatella aurantiaca]|uniref:Matrix-associated zinc metalloprotease FibA n=1 Tax=Stigmatella aurantiaca (strain DW4/3-1) TaxID=378806 RepID=Q09DU9_STIAD|nr:M4 family metallopeptidase [Stigmatella aurantiaca]ADO75215.1 Matrix-associated zinc metalloprotease FibA [Stigmatella aurantiaca DW4/3-1]EAU69949.1 matrix-associated zinc metalloprotease FibA [Stigmatella aurantiaca DW4/3-1]